MMPVSCVACRVVCWTVLLILVVLSRISEIFHSSVLGKLENKCESLVAAKE